MSTNSDDEAPDSGGQNGGGSKTRRIPLLPLRDIIVFPHMVVPLFVGREKSINALDQAMAHDREILLSAQKRATSAVEMTVAPVRLAMLTASPIWSS